MRTFATRTLWLTVFALLAPTCLAIDIGISPPRVALTGQPGETLSTTVNIITSAGPAQQVQVGVTDWTLDVHGDVQGLDAGTGAYGASAWMTPENDAFEMPGASTHPFRISVQIPNDPSLQGTYTSMVYFEIVPDVQPDQGVAVVTTTQIAFTVYVTIAGTETNGSRLEDMYQDDSGVMLTLSNDGNTLMRLGGRIELRDDSGVVRYKLPIDDLPILRDSERELEVALPEDVEPGFYVALALIEDSRGGLLTGQAQLEVP